MEAEDVKQRYIDFLLERIRDDRFPSGQLMDRVERNLSTPEQLLDYLEVLFENVESCTYPSLQMLDRIARLSR